MIPQWDLHRLKVCLWEPAAGIWTLQAGIFPENRASIALHERHGFRIVGHRRGLGQMAGRWRDVALLERRSTEVGT